MSIRLNSVLLFLCLVTSRQVFGVVLCNLHDFDVDPPDFYSRYEDFLDSQVRTSSGLSVRIRDFDDRDKLLLHISAFPELAKAFVIRASDFLTKEKIGFRIEYVGPQSLPALRLDAVPQGISDSPLYDVLTYTQRMGLGGLPVYFGPLTWMAERLAKARRVMAWEAVAFRPFLPVQGLTMQPEDYFSLEDRMKVSARILDDWKRIQHVKQKNPECWNVLFGMGETAAAHMCSDFFRSLFGTSDLSLTLFDERRIKVREAVLQVEPVGRRKVAALGRELNESRSNLLLISGKNARSFQVFGSHSASYMTLPLSAALLNDPPETYGGPPSESTRGVPELPNPLVVSVTDHKLNVVLPFPTTMMTRTLEGIGARFRAVDDLQYFVPPQIFAAGLAIERDLARERLTALSKSIDLEMSFAPRIWSPEVIVTVAEAQFLENNVVMAATLDVVNPDGGHYAVRMLYRNVGDTSDFNVIERQFEEALKQWSVHFAERMSRLRMTQQFVKDYFRAEIP